MDQLLETTLKNFYVEPPHKKTLRAQFDAAGIPRYKANPAAIRGGGPVYWSVSHVEKYLRSRLLPGRVPPLKIA
jgi:hypothetical protein